MANFEIIKAVISDKMEVAKDTIFLRLVRPTGGVFEFKPGQFATFTVAPNTKRSYSIASVPGKEYLDFIADTKIGGPGSMFFRNAALGDTVEIIVPLGNFFFIDTAKPVYFFSTGTGQVPFMSMAEQALVDLQRTAPMYLISGFRYEEDIFARQDLEMLDVKYENFIYQISLTQPTPEWQGSTGRITKFVDELQDTDIECYVCGSNQMVTDMVARLKAKGVPEAQIHFEMF
jgi:ferredoxin-NADP reductase